MKSKLLTYEEKIAKIEKELKKFKEQQLALKHKIKNKSDEYERTRAEYVSALLVENNMTLSDLAEMFGSRKSIGGE